MKRRPCFFARGLTMVELLVAVSVLGVLLAVAVPSLLDMIHRKRVEGVAQELASDLAQMKATAASRSHLDLYTYFRIGVEDSLNCYSMYVKTPFDDVKCNCLQPPGEACVSKVRPDAEIKTVKISESSGIHLVSSPRDYVYMKDFHSVSWPMQIRIEGKRAGVLRIDVDKGALIRVCTPDASMSGYPECP